VSFAANGDMQAKLPNVGYSGPFPNNTNILEVNWLNGTLAFTDIFSKRFHVTCDGKASVI
jgi:hypothetical protein